MRLCGANGDCFLAGFLWLKGDGILERRHEIAVSIEENSHAGLFNSLLCSSIKEYVELELRCSLPLEPNQTRNNYRNIGFDVANESIVLTNRFDWADWA